MSRGAVLFLKISMVSLMRWDVCVDGCDEMSGDPVSPCGWEEDLEVCLERSDSLVDIIFLLFIQIILFSTFLGPISKRNFKVLRGRFFMK